MLTAARPPVRGRPTRAAVAAVLMVLVGTFPTGCAGAGDPSVDGSSRTAAPSAPPGWSSTPDTSTAPPPTPTAGTAPGITSAAVGPSRTAGPAPSTRPGPWPASPPPASPPFAFESRELLAVEQAGMSGVSWRPGCPVPLADLRLVTMSHWGFDRKVATGRLVVHKDAVPAVHGAFERLFAAGFPIRRMRPIEAYRGDDYASIEDDNTSAFNCRPRVGSPGEYSQHSFGQAVDLNPLENPYVDARGRTSHPRSVTYLDRSRERPGMILPGGPAVAAFDAVGWQWGGRWSSPTDLQHFSSSGR